MKMKIAMLAAALFSAVLFLTGCSGELFNEYVTIVQYKDMEVEKIEPQEVTDDQVEVYIQSVQESMAETKEITDRAAELGDTAVIDYEGKKDGVAFDGGTDTNYPLGLGSGAFIPGFEEGIVGHSIGETFDVPLTFPETYKNNPDLAGQEVVFTVTLHSLSRREVPELDDAFVKNVSETSNTVEEYKKEIRESLEEASRKEAEAAFEESAWNALLENTSVNRYPREELQRTNAKIQEYYEGLAESYEMEFADFLAASMNMDEDTFLAEVFKEGKRRVKESLIIGLIAEKEDIDLSDEAKEPMYDLLAEDRQFDSAESLKKAIEANGLEEEFDQEARFMLMKKWLAANCKPVEKTTEE